MIRNDYFFDSINKQIIFSNPIDQSKLGIIVNVTNGIIIYNSMDTTKIGVLAGNVLTLTYDTSLMNNTDILQVFYSGGEMGLLDIFGPNPIVRDGELQIKVSDDPLYGDAGALQQHEKEQPNYPVRELLTYDTNLTQVLGTQNLVSNGTQRLKVEDAIAPEQVIQGVMGAVNQEVKINLTGQGSVALQLVGTWAGTMSFYGSIDGQNWNAIYGQIPGTAVGLVLTTTANGLFRFHTAGLLAFKVQFTAWTSGGARAILVSTPIGMINSHSFTSGSQSQLLAQKATTFELNTFDTSTAPSAGVMKDALQFPDYWNPKGVYNIGDTCNYQGQIYQCILAHSAITTAAATPTNTTYWLVDQRQNKSLIATQYVSSPNAARLRVEIDLDAYQYRLMESTLLSQQIQNQINIICNDYFLTNEQGQGGGYGKTFALGQSAMSCYAIEEVR